MKCIYQLTRGPINDAELFDDDLRNPVTSGGEGDVARQTSEHGAAHVVEDTLPHHLILVGECLQNVLITA